MKKQLTRFVFFAILLSSPGIFAQEVQTVFKGNGIKRSGGYAALSNKFTTINGDYANMPEIYGGWFVNSKFLLGASLAATTNYIPAPYSFNQPSNQKMTYQYGQFGLMTEYVFASNKTVHLVANMTTGAGFSLRYDRKNWDDYDHWDEWDDDNDNANFFFLLEPGVQLEVNLLKWMRFAPGVSYRKTFGAKGNGLSDSDLSNVSYNLTLKFGKF